MLSIVGTTVILAGNQGIPKNEVEKKKTWGAGASNRVASPAQIYSKYISEKLFKFLSISLKHELGNLPHNILSQKYYLLLE